MIDNYIITFLEKDSFIFFMFLSGQLLLWLSHSDQQVWAPFGLLQNYFPTLIANWKIRKSIRGCRSNYGRIEWKSNSKLDCSLQFIISSRLLKALFHSCLKCNWLFAHTLIRQIDLNSISHFTGSLWKKMKKLCQLITCVISGMALYSRYLSFFPHKGNPTVPL